MSLLIPNASEVALLSFMLGKTTPSNQTLKLFVNNVTPADGHTVSDYTEMSTHGYSAKTLSLASWSVASSGGVGTGTYAAQTFSFTSAASVTVYGYYVVDSSTGALLWAERFATPYNIQFTGDAIVITPTITLSKV